MGIITLQWCWQNENTTASVYTGSLQAHKLAALYVHRHLGGTLCRSLWPTTTLQWNSAICLWIWRTRRITQIQGTQSKRADFEAPLRHRCNIWSVSHWAQSHVPIVDSLPEAQYSILAVVLISITVIYESTLITLEVYCTASPLVKKLVHGIDLCTHKAPQWLYPSSAPQLHNHRHPQSTFLEIKSETGFAPEWHQDKTSSDWIIFSAASV